MKQYSIFHVPLMAFYSKELYRDMAFNWKGICFGYILLLLAVCWVPAAVQLQIEINTFMKNDAPEIVSKMPDITITNGVASFDVSQPHIITNSKTGKVLVILDSTGKYSSLDKINASALITNDRAILKKNANEIKTYKFEGINELKLDRQGINEWLDMAGKFLAPLYYALSLLVSFLFRATQLLIFGAIGLFFASWAHVNLPYSALLRLSAAAITPGVIVDTVADLAGSPIPMSGTLLLLAAMGYLYFGVRAAAQKEKAERPR
jgi:hypothetical protein